MLKKFLQAFIYKSVNTGLLTLLCSQKRNQILYYHVPQPKYIVLKVKTGMSKLNLTIQFKKKPFIYKRGNTGLWNVYSISHRLAMATKMLTSGQPNLSRPSSGSSRRCLRSGQRWGTCRRPTDSRGRTKLRIWSWTFPLTVNDLQVTKKCYPMRE